MADRGDLLDRLVLALSRPGVNGVLGTPDILEDLLLLGALDGKAVFGSMNRGGLAGAAWAIDDRFTAYDAASIAAAGFEGGKMLLRIDPTDERTARDARGVRARGLRARRAPADRDGRAVLVAPAASNDLSPEAAIKAIGDRVRARHDVGVHVAEGARSWRRWSA